MGSPPKIGRFSTQHQPTSTPSQPARYVSAEERERLKTEADVEAREPARDERARDGIPTDLSPAEREAAEAEKQALLADLKQTRPAKPGPERSAPESLSSHPIVDISEVAPSREVEMVASSRLDALESAEQELIALEREESASLDEELRSFEEKTAIQMARLREAGEAKRAEIRKRQEEQRAVIERERAAALPAEMARKAKLTMQTAEANRTRRDAGLESQREEFAQSWSPLLATAKQTLAEVRQIDKTFGPSLREMGNIAAFTDTNAAWPTELRFKLRDRCILPARALVQILNNTLARDDEGSPRDTIRQAEVMLQHWTPKTPVANLRQLLSYIGPDLVRHLRVQIQEINGHFDIILAQGTEYVRSGAVPREVTINLDTERIRREAKEAHIFRNLTDPRQHTATGIGDTNLPR